MLLSASRKKAEKPPFSLDLQAHYEVYEVYETIVRTATTPMVITDTLGKVVICNLAAKQIWGGGEAEMMDNYPSYIEEENSTEFQSLIAQILAGKPITGMKTSLYTRMGKRIYLELNVSPIRNSGGQTIGSLAIIRDITHQQKMEEALWRSEHRFAAFMDHLPGCAWMKDLEGHYVYVNRAMKEQPHYKDCLGKTDAEVLPAELAKRLQDCDLLVANSNQSHQTLEPYVRNEEWREQLVHRFPIFAQDHTTKFVGGISLDVTEQRRTKAELQKADKRLEELSRRLLEAREIEKGNLARELHDEVGQSLTAVKLELENAQRLANSEPLILQLEDGIALIDQLIKMVRTISLNLRPALLDELGLSAAIREHLYSQAERSGFQVHFEIHGFNERLDPLIETSCFRVAQEAITNIVRHACAQTVDVELTQREFELSILIRDDGRGFDTLAMSEGLERVTGFGMFSMRERVELCGGGFFCQSTLGEGTEIRATFPLQNTNR